MQSRINSINRWTGCDGLRPGDCESRRMRRVHQSNSLGRETVRKLFRDKHFLNSFFPLRKQQIMIILIGYLTSYLSQHPLVFWSLSNKISTFSSWDLLIQLVVHNKKSPCDTLADSQLLKPTNQGNDRYSNALLCFYTSFEVMYWFPFSKPDHVPFNKISFHEQSHFPLCFFLFFLRCRGSL